MNEAEDLLAQFKSEGLELLKQMLADSYEETLWLDFKTIKNNIGPLSRDDLATLSEGMSAFANADGGLLVWGADCRSPKGNEPDVLQALPGVGNCADTLAQMKRACRTYLAPGVEGVEHFSIDDGTDSDRGFIVT